MPALNHHIVSVIDSEASAHYYCDVLGLEPAVKLGQFAVLKVSGDTTLDFITVHGEFDRQHYAFLVTEEEFDEIFARVKAHGQAYWSDPMHDDPDHINHWDDGRGVYFDDLDGHRLEIITRPYGSGGTEAEHVHPLIAPSIDGTETRLDIH